MSDWKKIDLLIRSVESTQYADRMAEQLKKVPKRKVNTEQAPSTARILAMTKEERDAHSARGIPENWKADRYATWKGDPREIPIAMGIRQAAKNMQGDAVGEGARSTTEETREKAASALTCTPPANVHNEIQKRVENLVGFMSKPVSPEDPKKDKTFIEKIKDMFSGKGKSYEDEHPGAIKAWEKILGVKK